MGARAGPRLKQVAPLRTVVITHGRVVQDGARSSRRQPLVVNKNGVRSSPAYRPLVVSRPMQQRDPPLIETLKPLPTAELRRRCAALEEGTQAQSSSGTRQDLLEALVAAYERRPRVERRCRGKPLPPQLAAELTAELQRLQWPKKSARPGLDSERYLVLPNRRGVQACGTRHPHFQLRQLCDAAVAFASPAFEHTAIAVTKNFVGSPHIDAFDRSEQLATSLGDVSGGELCVDDDPSGIEGSSSGGGGEPRHSVAVVETLNCVASLDGRHVHWVRSFNGGDRFSIIWYNTESEQQTGQLTEPSSKASHTASSRQSPRDARLLLLGLLSLAVVWCVVRRRARS